MKKVLLFTEVFANGGIEKIMIDIKDNIDYDCSLLCINNNSTIYSKYQIGSLLYKKYKRAMVRNLKSFIRFKNYFKNNTFDVVHIHTHWGYGLIWARIASKYCDNIVLHAHNSKFQKDYFKFKALINWVMKILFKSKKYKYVACSFECGKFCFGNIDYQIIYNGIDINKYRFNLSIRNKYRKDFKYDKKDLVIASIGRLEIQKNPLFLLETFRLITENQDNCYLVIIGDGNMYHDILEYINKYSLKNRVRIFKNRDDLYKMYNMFDFVFMPSLFEGFPLALLEAQYNSICALVSSRIDSNVVVNNISEQISLDVAEWVDCFNEKINYEREKVVIKTYYDIKDFISNIKDVYEKKQ